ncbi:hypothetical protein QCA50_000061 [Cerrena zonata]|uniref:Kinesin-like protein n=1 Tax=Cerrena zonata TaxID=2478898 RepID=A0AAW0GZA1_9APHY
MATLSIIDLAGSERAAATTNMGQRMVEGANINKSLLALGNCINALCESGGAIRHVPYRNSKLTRLLKFSLGGNCKTVMIVCVAPTSLHFDDTHNTLVYAERATKIKTKVVTRNVVNVDRHVGQYVEAIKRLNDEVAELKAKLAGKRDTESDKENRRKKEAISEVEKAKTDMQLKMEQTQAAIIDGAACAGKISVAEAKLKAIRARLAELNNQASSSSSPLSSDLEAERGLLQALAGPEEEAVQPRSVLSTRVLRSNNSGAMFEATLRAVSERRSDKMDETSVDNIKLDSRWRKAEMERVKAEASRDAIREAVGTQAQMVVSLIGMVGRCTVMMTEASRLLKTTVENDKEHLDNAAEMLAISLQNIAESNNEAFKNLLGHTVEQYKPAPMADAPSSFDSFKRNPSTFGATRIASGPAISQQPKTRVSRRSSSASNMGSPLRKSHRSPRKSIRSSFAPPYRRASDNNSNNNIHNKDKGKKKGVQWRDEAGQGNIDDGGLGATPPVIAIQSPGNTVISPPSFNEESASTSTSRLGRSTPIGSESDWEDEKTDDSVNFSFISAPRDLSASSSMASATRSSTKRSRPSRLDPGFLKTRSKGPTLSSLTEDDEGPSSPRRLAPLGNRNMNRASSPSSESSSSNGDTMETLHVPKGRERLGSPGKRGPGSPNKSASISTKPGRRRSNIGPVRVERARRRSSMIPQLSPANRRDSGEAMRKSISAGPRRVAVERSPAKRPKRQSLLALSQQRLATTSKLRSADKLKSVDPNASADISFRGGSGRPTWR